jgi:hypothetical protein
VWYAHRRLDAPALAALPFHSRFEGTGEQRAIRSGGASDEDAKINAYLRASIAATVRASSFAQSAKGVLTAGIVKSVVYAARKVMKARR